MEDRKRLVEENIALAKSIANHFYYNPNSVYDADDLFQEACLALWKAAEGYDEGKGVKFSTYAYTVIINHLRNKTSQANMPYKEKEFVSLNNLSNANMYSDLGQEGVEDISVRVLSIKELERYLEKKKAYPKIRQGRRMGIEIIQQILKGKSRKEIMDTLDITDKKYDNCLYRMRKELKAELFGEDGGDGI